MLQGEIRTMWAYRNNMDCKVWHSATSPHSFGRWISVTMRDQILHYLIEWHVCWDRISVIAWEYNHHLKKSVKFTFTKPIWYNMLVSIVVDTSSIIVAVLRPEWKIFITTPPIVCGKRMCPFPCIFGVTTEWCDDDMVTYSTHCGNTIAFGS